MTGTRVGGLKAKEKNLKANPNFYAEIGRKGGIKGGVKGFAANRALASIAGRKGGLISKRGPAKPKDPEAEHRSNFSNDSVIQQEIEDYWYSQGEAVAREMLEDM